MTTDAPWDPSVLDHAYDPDDHEDFFDSIQELQSFIKESPFDEFGDYKYVEKPYFQQYVQLAEQTIGDKFYQPPLMPQATYSAHLSEKISINGPSNYGELEVHEKEITSPETDYSAL